MVLAAGCLSAEQYARTDRASDAPVTSPPVAPEAEPEPNPEPEPEPDPALTRECTTTQTEPQCKLLCLAGERLHVVVDGAGILDAGLVCGGEGANAIGIAPRAYGISWQWAHADDEGICNLFDGEQALCWSAPI